MIQERSLKIDMIMQKKNNHNNYININSNNGVRNINNAKEMSITKNTNVKNYVKKVRNNDNDIKNQYNVKKNNYNARIHMRRE